ncbi:MAG: LuxR family transcriptional regulator [Confluentimicrobium sp.]|uniref:helix-turn-helix transcriptional regulator n=1 Tax=Actibacterium sp. TaxID=1872125 RepID=UPI00050F8D27|nr:helix-turn-helix transcriptional regulator [Actibacterium sp.]KGB83552.1 LuxR family transcriptional regulator [Rhodovulum sp. NI22]MBC56517.1 LuxR family transcriptional regulator [Actibacterium sp.]MDY6860170.1 helix-turn-helix transcriptional regulator [Pseudomonadota bacterium]
MKDRVFVIAILLVQAICAVFFVSDIVLSVVGLRTTPISWQTRELLEIGAAVGLILGLVLGAVALRRTMQKTQRYQEQLRVASGAFAELMQERFAQWALTPAEKDVALFAIKGLSTQEIAALRNTSEGTVKAQTNAIYRKAGVSGRPQLLSLFIEDLMDDALLGKAG